jgi:hypothetical protein
MIPVIQESGQNCLLVALACVMGKRPCDVAELIGKSGSEIIPEWAHLPPPLNTRSLHIDEINIACIPLGYAFIQVNRYLQMAPPGYAELAIMIDESERYDRLIKNNMAIIICTREHALHAYVHLPNGHVWDLTRWLIREERRVMIRESRTALIIKS